MKRPPIYDTYHYVHRLGDRYAFRVGAKHTMATPVREITTFAVEVFLASYPANTIDGSWFTSYKEAVRFGNEAVDKLRSAKKGSYE